eukprot:2541826-Rhodomonas_salina.1
MGVPRRVGGGHHQTGRPGHEDRSRGQRGHEDRARGQSMQGVARAQRLGVANAQLLVLVAYMCCLDVLLRCGAYMWCWCVLLTCVADIWLSYVELTCRRCGAYMWRCGPYMWARAGDSGASPNSSRLSYSRYHQASQSAIRAAKSSNSNRLSGTNRPEGVLSKLICYGRARPSPVLTQSMVQCRADSGHATTSAIHRTYSVLTRSMLLRQCRAKHSTDSEHATNAENTQY